MFDSYWIRHCTFACIHVLFMHCLTNHLNRFNMHIRRLTNRSVWDKIIVLPNFWNKIPRIRGVCISISPQNVSLPNWIWTWKIVLEHLEWLLSAIFKRKTLKSWQQKHYETRDDRQKCHVKSVLFELFLLLI